jgi:predicted enzyme related to lactoylglutathione lyase
MALIHECALGMPCWFKLGTTDRSAAQQYYGQLFGWSVIDNPMGRGKSCTSFQLDGREVCATYTRSPKILQEGVLSRWNVYFAAPDVDATTAKIATLGGSVVQPPFNVMDIGVRQSI